MRENWNGADAHRLVFVYRIEKETMRDATVRPSADDSARATECLTFTIPPPTRKWNKKFYPSAGDDADMNKDVSWPGYYVGERKKKKSISIFSIQYWVLDEQSIAAIVFDTFKRARTSGEKIKKIE